MLNRDRPETPPEDDNEEVEELGISVAASTLVEIRTAVKALKNRGSPRSRPDHS